MHPLYIIVRKEVARNVCNSLGWLLNACLFGLTPPERSCTTYILYLVHVVDHCAAIKCKARSIHDAGTILLCLRLCVFGFLRHGVILHCTCTWADCATELSNPTLDPNTTSGRQARKLHLWTSWMHRYVQTRSSIRLVLCISPRWMSGKHVFQHAHVRVSKHKLSKKEHAWIVWDCNITRYDQWLLVWHMTWKGTCTCTVHTYKCCMYMLQNTCTFY